MKVAIQGDIGAFSQQAALQIVDRPDIVPCRTFEDAFAALADGSADLAVIPVENTLAGTVTRPMDLIASHGVHAVAETLVRVRLCVATRPGTTLADARTIASHPVALLQCRRFLADHPWLEVTETWDTAGSIRDLMRGAPWDAAVGSELACSIHGATVVARDIEDDAGNYTRFLALRTRPLPGPELGKLSLAFTLRNRPGALHGALGIFAERSLDLTRLDCRPQVGRPWEYRFYADVVPVDADLERALLEALGAFALEVQVIGRYPVAVAAAESTGDGRPVG